MELCRQILSLSHCSTLQKATAGIRLRSTSMMVIRRLELKEGSSSMSAGDDCLTSDVLRGVVQAGEEDRLGSKLAEVAPGRTSS
jgi:hypothetical protein